MLIICIRKILCRQSKSHYLQFIYHIQSKVSKIPIPIHSISAFVHINFKMRNLVFIILIYIKSWLLHLCDLCHL